MLLETWWDRVFLDKKKPLYNKFTCWCCLICFELQQVNRCVMLMKPSDCCWYSHVLSRSWGDTGAHAQRNHLMAERLLFHRTALAQSGTQTVSMRDRLLQGSNRLPYEDWALETAAQVCGRFAHGGSPHEMQPCGGLNAAFWIARSLHGSSRECHENQKSWLRDCCSSLSKARRRRRRWREMDTARKIRIR